MIHLQTVHGVLGSTQAGVGQGDWINQALSSGKAQLLWKAVNHSSEGFIQDLAVNTASGVIDIAIDVLDLTLLGYIKFAIESALLFNTLLDIDEEIVKKATVVFENFSLDPFIRSFACCIESTFVNERHIKPPLQSEKTRNSSSTYCVFMQYNVPYIAQHLTAIHKWC